MYNRVFCLLLMLVMVVSLVGCSGPPCPVPTVPTPVPLPPTVNNDEWSRGKKEIELATGFRMRYREFGPADAPTIILLHGLTDSSRSWSLTVPFLGQPVSYPSAGPTRPRRLGETALLLHHPRLCRRCDRLYGRSPYQPSRDRWTFHGQLGRLTDWHRVPQSSE